MSAITPWLWPDRVIGKRESRVLREEQNALYNSHAELMAALRTMREAHNSGPLTQALQALEDAEFLLRQAGKLPGPMQDSFRRSAEDARAAIAKAKGGVNDVSLKNGGLHE